MNNIIIKNANELVTCSGFDMKKGSEMDNLNVITDGCVVITEGKIEKVGKTKEVLKDLDLKGYKVVDATGKCVLPGFIDSHTHFIFSGYRDKEFNDRLKGKSYMDIAKEGGGIVSTVKDTREASLEELVSSGYERLSEMIKLGVTTVEGKSGYGLDIDTEMKQLLAMNKLNDIHQVDVVSTYMGAHEIPEEYKGRNKKYLDFLVKEAMPEIIEKDLAIFCDIFTEKNVFSIDESREYLKEAKKLGFKLKMHADEMFDLKGASLAAELGCTSADHLLNASKEGLLEMIDKDVVSTLLPLTAFSLKENFADAKFIIENGGALALATDYNPGSAHSYSIPLVIALATIYMDMTIEQTISALTINAAAAINKQGEIGSLDEGKKGDVIILNAPSYNFLSYCIGLNIVETVIKDGIIVVGK